MSDNQVMFSLIAVIGVFSAGAVLAANYGADSRRPADRNW